MTFSSGQLKLREMAEEYERLRCICGVNVQEADDAFAPEDEHALQGLWAQQVVAAGVLHLTDGTPIEVIEPGRWNHADGPDFRDAIVIIDGALHRGDVELHLRPADWDLHGHAKDPAYGGLLLHVTWFSTPLAKTLSPHVPTLALEQLLPTLGQTFSNHSRKPLELEHPCFVRLKKTPLAVDRLLAAAGYARLLAKMRRFVEGLQTEDAMQVFYENLMATMGYGRNAEPFKRLAREYPLTLLVPFPIKSRFAILARSAGLLKEDSRELWDLWWASGIQPPLEPYTWDFRGMRPQNHPFRRLAGALGILAELTRLLELPLADLPKALIKAADVLRKDIGASAALIGFTRAAAITVNLFVPYRLALGTLSERQLHTLPGEDVSMPMRETWKRLTGRQDGIPKDGLRQQGLLQIYTDFCHNPRVVCATCPIASEAL